MSQQNQPSFPPPSTGIPVPLPADSSLWDRISNWVSENKAVVYTIAGVTVVVAGASVYYYTSDSSVRHPTLLAFVASDTPAVLSQRCELQLDTDPSCGLHY